MPRTRATAKKAGSTFERIIADYFAKHVDDRVDRRVKTGGKDKGDIAGLRHMGQRLVIECKNTAKIALGMWAGEAEAERGNDDALAGIVIHKRVGKAQPEDQWVTMTVGELVALLTGSREHLIPQDETWLADTIQSDITTPPDHREKELEIIHKREVLGEWPPVEPNGFQIILSDPESTLVGTVFPTEHAAQVHIDAVRSTMNPKKIDQRWVDPSIVPVRS